MRPPLRQQAQELLQALHPTPGSTLYLVIGDSKKAKRGWSWMTSGAWWCAPPPARGPPGGLRCDVASAGRLQTSGTHSASMKICDTVVVLPELGHAQDVIQVTEAL
jgi:hypothetical protein